MTTNLTGYRNNPNGQTEERIGLRVVHNHSQFTSFVSCNQEDPKAKVLTVNSNTASSHTVEEDFFHHAI